MDGIHGTLVLVDEPLHLFLEPLLIYVEPMMILIVKPLHIHCEVVMDIGKVHICCSHGDHAHACPYRTLGMGMLNGIHMVVTKKEKPMRMIG